MICSSVTSVRASLLLALVCSACATRLAEDPTEDGATGPALAADVAAFDGSAIDITSDGGMTSEADAEEAASPDAQKVQPTGPALSTNGVPCSVNAECMTGSCVDGVCCSSASCGGCQSCNVAGSEGACTPMPKDAEDPRSSCVDTSACDGTGRCALYLGNYCKTGNDCISGFCVDGICCDSACDQQCYACSRLGSFRGKCTAVNGPDESSSAPCTGASSCLVNPSGQPSCLLKDGQACSVGGECVSGACRTFFADADGDTWGGASRPIQICVAMPTPPEGYAIRAGDCCDEDGRANPGATDTYHSSPDVCGSFDYDCSGALEKFRPPSSATCSGNVNGAADCGKVCTAFILGRAPQAYTQECR